MLLPLTLSPASTNDVLLNEANGAILLRVFAWGYREAEPLALRIKHCIEACDGIPNDQLIELASAHRDARRYRKVRALLDFIARHDGDGDALQESAKQHGIIDLLETFQAEHSDVSPTATEFDALIDKLPLLDLETIHG